MGQQQLLLIVLGVIVVGIAIVVGINLFNANAVAANRDAVISDLNNLGSLAVSYYKKPKSMGGGANSFVGFSVPSNLATTANGTYTAGTMGATSAVFTGVGNEKGDNGSSGVSYTATVYVDSVVIAKYN